MADTYMVLSTKSELYPNDAVHLKLKELSDGTFALAVDTTVNVAEPEPDNYEVQVLAPAIRAVSAQTVPFVNSIGAKGMIIFLDVASPVPGGGETLTLFVDHYDPGSDDYMACFQAGAVSAAGHRHWVIYPAGVVDDGSMFTALQRTPLGSRWRVRVLHSGSGTWYYSVGAVYVP